jgi:soluble lytic murein transglycosylase-like protein
MLLGRFFWVFWFLCLSLLGQPLLHAANPGPRLKTPDHRVIKKCFERQDPESMAAFFASQLKWNITCSLDELRSEMRGRAADSWPPHVQLLTLSQLFEEYRRFRAKFFIQQAEESRYENPEGFLWNPLLERKSTVADLAPELGPKETPLEAFRAASQTWIEDMGARFESLWGGKVFHHEASLLWVQILAAQGDFARLRAELEGRFSFLLSQTRDRDFVLRTLFEYAENQPTEAEVLRPLLMKSLEYLPNVARRNLNDTHLDLWIRYLHLQGRPQTRIQTQELLKTLRDLWISFPLRDHKVKLRKLAMDLGVSRQFVGPSERQMKIEELLAHADRQIRLLEGDAALKTLEQVLRLTPQQFSAKELWDALELHVRLLRIMDQRHKISDLLDRYIQKGKFLDIPSKANEREEFFKKLYAIGRWHWTYDSPQKALATFDRIISLNRAWGTDFELATSYYVRARIMEQSGDRVVARMYFEEAIQEMSARARTFSDLYEDLLWRRFFNEFDQASGHLNYQNLLQLIDEMKPFVSKDDEGERWFFWKALALLAAGQQEQAIKNFEEAYSKTPLSYYSVVSGLELIKLDKKPPKWNLPDASRYWLSDDEWKESSYTDFFNARTLKPKSDADLAWAQVYGLGSIGFFEEARRYLPALERRVYAQAGNRSQSIYFRKRVLRRAGWLRLAVGDQIGSLRMGELARITFSGDVDAEDLAYLYPLPFKDLVIQGSEKQRIDPWHVVSLIRQESAFNPQARSIANALGLMQIIPPVAQADAKTLGIENFVPEMLLEPAMAIHMGTFHLGELVRLFDGSVIASTAGYNAGRPPVYNWLRHYTHPVPYVFIDRISFAETRKYVRSIIRNYANYSRIYSGGEFDIDALMKMPTLMPGEAVK